MATSMAGALTDWRQEWFEFEGAAYLNAAANAPMPKVALRAAQASLEWKKFPNKIPDAAYFETPSRVRGSIARLIGAKPEEIALNTGASAGMAPVAYGLEWKPGDEVLTAKGEFPLQYTTWKPMEEREGIKMRVVEPGEKFLRAEDFIAALTPRTKLVSASMVRFNDGTLLDAAKLAAACHAQGTMVLLDVSQCCGAIPMSVRELGADFLVCAGYKWLLGPFGTGFLWMKHELIGKLRPGPYYWMAAEGAEKFAALAFSNPKPVDEARRWDTAETASYFNLGAMAASLELVLRVGPENVAAHTRGLIDQMLERLPKDRCVAASPLEANRRGPYGCFTARSAEKTAELYQRLQSENIVVSLREGNIRVSPHIYNTEQEIDKLIATITR